MKHTVSDIITDEELNAIIDIESAGDPNNKARTSSALGLGQFLNATWLAVVKKHRPDLFTKRTNAQVLKLRTTPQIAVELLARFTEDNKRSVGMQCSPGDLYLAHFLGTGAAKKVYKAPANSRVEPLVGVDAVKANRSILEGKTCGQVRAWAERKMATHGRHDWVSKFYKVPTPTPRPIPEDEKLTKVEAPEAEVDTHDEPEVAQEEATAEVTDATPHGQVNDTIANLQRALDEMGYHEVGIINGAWGGGTRAALAACLNDLGIDDVADMRKSNMDAIAKAKLEGFKRPVVKERAEATAKELAPKNITILASLRNKALAVWTSIVTFVMWAISEAGDKLSDYWDKLAVPRKLFGQVPGFVWVILVIIALFAFWFNAKRSTDDTLDKFQTRKLLQ